MKHEAMFIDTSVVLRMLLNDHDDHSPRARGFFEDANVQARTAWVSETVLFETIYVLEKSHKIPRDRIVMALRDFMDLAAVSYLGVANLDETLDLYLEHAQLSIADCLHAALARQIPGATIVSYDLEFDRVEGLHRVEPPPLLADQ